MKYFFLWLGKALFKMLSSQIWMNTILFKMQFLEVNNMYMGIVHGYIVKISQE